MTVRSTNLFLGTLSASGQTLYTVPSGYRAIVKEINVTHVGSSSTTRVQVRRSGSTKAYLMWQALASNVPVRIPMWTILNDTDTLVMITDAGTPSTVEWCISGTELIL